MSNIKYQKPPKRNSPRANRNAVPPQFYCSLFNAATFQTRCNVRTRKRLLLFQRFGSEMYFTK